jgi:phosphatidylglycerol:prolipoprotein diacylglycerol transferase
MWQILYDSGGLKWPAYAFLYGMAGSLFMALSVILARGHNVPLRPRRVLDWSLGFLAAYIILSRLGSVLYQQPENYIEESFNLAAKGRATHIAAFLIAIIFLLVGWKRWKLNRLWACWAGPFLLAVAVGYIGCYCYGCCYGRPAEKDFPLAVQFPVIHNNHGRVVGAPAAVEQNKEGLLPPDAKHSLPVHPTQLYYVVLYGVLGLFVTLGAALRPRREWFFAAMWLYFLVRVIVDPFRSFGGDMTIYEASPLVRGAQFGFLTLVGVVWLFLKVLHRGDITKQTSHGT